METIFEYVLQELKDELVELSIRSILQSLKKTKSREARRIATQKKLELRRAKDKLKVKETARKISKSNKEKAMWRKTPVRVSVKPLKRIEFKPRS